MEIFFFIPECISRADVSTFCSVLFLHSWSAAAMNQLIYKHLYVKVIGLKKNFKFIVIMITEQISIRIPAKS